MQQTSVFEEDFRAQGEIRSKNDVLFKGGFIGNLHISAHLEVSDGGEIDGDVSCDSLVLKGKINGNVEVAQCAELGENAYIGGHLITSRLKIHHDAFILGGLRLETKTN